MIFKGEWRILLCEGKIEWMIFFFLWFELWWFFVVVVEEGLDCIVVCWIGNLGCKKNVIVVLRINCKIVKVFNVYLNLIFFNKKFKLKG